jgi:hypothetical protein
MHTGWCVHTAFQIIQPGLLLPQQTVGFFDRNRLEANDIPGAALADDRKICRNDRGNLGLVSSISKCTVL